METPSVDRESHTPDQAYAPTSVIAEHYRVERELGRGGMATVYLCTDLRDQKQVAIKVLRHELGSAVIIERFLREIAFASELDHPQIPKVLGSGVIDDVPYYVMTYIDGESLKKRLDREKQLPIADALKIACAIIEPTSYAHKRGIVHRDIKPDNVLISKDGVFVLDFGIARAIIESGGDRLTSTGIGVGTPAYMSPEQALGDRNLDVRSDIYSIGCVVYEMIAGIPPFVGPTAQVIISRRFAAPPPPLSEVRDNVPESVEDAIMKALAKSPADRWATVSEFGDALRACTNDTRRRFKTPTIEFRRSSVARVAIGVGLVAVVATGVLAWSLGRGGGFEKAQEAIQAWDFNSAETNFRNAVSADGSDARAQLWLAQTLMLQGSPASQWRAYARFASEHATDLTPNDRTRAAALVSLTSGDFAAACSKMAQLAAAERQQATNNFISTLALADCLKDDATAVADKTSPSGYQFQSSYHLADSLYEGLIDRYPTSPAIYALILPRLEQVLTIDKSNHRNGARQGNTRELLMALPELVADTLAYTPYPIAGSRAPWRSGRMAAVDAALDRNRQRLRELARAWAQSAPNDSRPHEVLARVLEANGQLRGGENSALQELRRARVLAAGARQPAAQRYLTQLRLGKNQVRLFLRLNQFDQAGPLADSLLSLPMPQGLPEDGIAVATDSLTPLAALRGRPLRVIELSQQAPADIRVLLPTGEVAVLPHGVVADQHTLEGYAEAGGPADSILALAARVSEKIAAVLPPAQVAGMQSGALMRPLTLAAPVVGPGPVAQLGPTMDPLVIALRAFAQRNIPRTRAALDSLAALHADFAPGEITMDAIYLEAWLRTQIGDTTRASDDLDKALRGLSAALPSILGNSAVAASLVRVMALRAELAAAKQQRDVARKWANAVVQLWGQGDAVTRPTVERMRKLR